MFGFARLVCKKDASPTGLIGIGVDWNCDSARKLRVIESCLCFLCSSHRLYKSIFIFIIYSKV